MFPDVVILAGGLGKRLHSVTGGSQKVLAKVNGRPFLEILMDYIYSQGGRHFILCVGHGSEQVEAYFKDKYRNRRIDFSKEDSPLGTGGAIKKALTYVETDQFLAMNGDCFCLIEYAKLIAEHEKNRANATIAITKMLDIREYGNITVNEKKQIIAFNEKSTLLKAGFINTGTYCLNHDVFNLVPGQNKFSIEYDFFPQLIGKRFHAFEVENKFIDIGTPERYSWAQEHLKEMMGLRGKW